MLHINLNAATTDL